MTEQADQEKQFAELRARADALEARLREQEASTAARLVQAELKAEAIRAGMIDLDGLKLVDTSAVKLGSAGELEGAGELMSKLRRAKPWLFGNASSSAAASPPPAQPPQPKTAMDMSEPEWRAARAELLRRR